MEKNFLEELSSLETFDNLRNKLNSEFNTEKVVYSSELKGSSKAVFISKLLKKNNQILILVPKRLDVNELHVEFSILGLDDKLVSIDSIEMDSIQEKLTTIKNKHNSIIISTYDSTEG